ncbi:MAG: hypothetical protein KAS70_05400 [Planctomycetes bacterium]|nr:hypothetical protein [Planctomycetota bacterium]MCK5577892.1 hypothetical protein [Planctomycetota bacterium]
MFRVVILNPSEVIYEGLAESVFLPGSYGELEILDFHCPIITTLKQGRIRVDDQFFNVKHGLVRMNLNNELVILVDS